MDVQSILIAAAVVGAVGLFAGLLLGIASEKFKVKINETEVKVRECLPGNNCGACGFPGCDGLAAAIAGGEASPGSCPVGGAPVEAKIKEVLEESKASTDGQTLEQEEADKADKTSDSEVKKVAHVRCRGTCDKAKDAYEYIGPHDCRTASNTPGGGPKACANGCLGMGSCVKACQFNAINIVNGVAVIDRDKCRSCTQCVAVCPRGIIEMVPYDAAGEGATALVECSSRDFGKDVKAVCAVGCIGCGMCARNCPTGAITVEGNLAHVDYGKCTGCGVCRQKCPVKVII